MDNNLYESINPTTGAVQLDYAVTNMQSEGYAIAVPVATVSPGYSGGMDNSQAGVPAADTSNGPQVLVITNPFSN